MDMNGAIVLLASLMVLSAMAPKMVAVAQGDDDHDAAGDRTPEVVTKDGLGPIVTENAMVMVKIVGPIAAVCMVAGLLVNIAQVRWQADGQAAQARTSRRSTR